MSDGEHSYKPQGSALQLFKCRAPEVLLAGAAGTGKSRACLEKLHFMMLKNPGARGLIVRKTLTSLGSTALVTYREHVAKEAIDSGEVKYFGGSGQVSAQYRYGNGSTITIGGMDKASRIMSSEYDVVYCQEATELTEEDWESITTRLRNGKISFQQLMADCNPAQPQHWLNQRSIEGKTVQITCKHEDNPRLFNGKTWTPEGESYLAKLDNLTGVRYLRLRKGLWSAAEGLVYENYDPEIHLRPHLIHPPDSWTRYLSVDFGYRNPFTALWAAVDEDGRVHIYKELYMTGRLVEDHAAVILKNMKTKARREPDFQAIICDHDAEDRATLERKLEMSTVNAMKNVSEGIQAVQERLKPDADGIPRLIIHRDSLIEKDSSLADAHKPVCLADEILEYTWDTQSSQRSMHGSTLKEHPLKQNDHALDALRYLIAHIDLQKKPRVRMLTW